jgi:uncharacterized protein YndB with AHSA1/START domain
MTTTIVQTTQVYQVFIKASAEQIWEAITRPEWTARYFHGARITATPDHYDSRGPDGDVWGDSSVEVFDPPRKLVHGWRSLYDSELIAEEESRVTWEIEEDENGVCLLTVTHDKLEGAPMTAVRVSGAGWMGVISALKTLLETGEPLYGGA